MKNVEDEEQLKDLVVNTLLIFYLQMSNKYVSNNYRNEGFGMWKFEDDMSGNWLNQQQFLLSHQGIRTIIRFVGTISKKVNIINKCIVIVSR
jgi:hypothetical protein